MQVQLSSLEVGDLVSEGSLELTAVGSLETERRISGPDLQKPGLALAGHLESLHAERVQVLGASEVSYLCTLSGDQARARFSDFCAAGPPCVIVADVGQLSAELVAMLRSVCAEAGVPLLRSSLASQLLMRQLGAFLRARLNPSLSIHGVMIDVFGVGVLIRGKSGIGKSEIALDLVMRGHRLVADDVVDVLKVSTDALVARGPDLIKHHIEIRGLGILNIKDLFGVASIRDSKRLELIVDLIEWEDLDAIERLGVDDRFEDLLGVAVATVTIPVRPGRNLTSIIEVAARNQLLKLRGHHSAREFSQRLTRELEIGQVGRPERE